MNEAPNTKQNKHNNDKKSCRENTGHTTKLNSEGTKTKRQSRTNYDTGREKRQEVNCS